MSAGAALQEDDHVHQGVIHNYTWYVTERASPAPSDGSSIMWMYHSHTHEIQDSYAGLMGGIIVTRKVCFFRAVAAQDYLSETVMREGP